MTTNLFTAIDELVPKLEGWCSPKKAQTLAAAVLALRPELIVEIGVYGGRSLIPMALSLQSIGHGKIIGIDPWSAPVSASGQVHPNDQQFWGRLDHEPIRLGFLRWVQTLGLQDFVQVEHMESDAFDVPQSINFLHSDGNHGIQALRDARRFAPAVRIGGLVFLDDCDWTGGAVRMAEEHLLQNGFVMLYKEDPGAMYQRVK